MTIYVFEQSSTIEYIAVIAHARKEHMPEDRRTSLLRERREAIERLGALATEKRPDDVRQDYAERSSDIIRDIFDLDRIVDFLKPPSEIPFAECDNAIDAVMMYLEIVGRPVTAKEIVTKTIEGGFKGRKPGADIRVQKSIKMHLKASPDTEMGQKIKSINGLVGLFTWDGSRF